MGEYYMPQILKIGPYVVYFWSNEGAPLEPVHIHITEGQATAFATKLWVTSTGKIIVANNNSKIPEAILRRMIRILEGNSDYIIERWLTQFGEIRYYC